MTELGLAYAVTVHKSQGSEFKAVYNARRKCNTAALLQKSALYRRNKGEGAYDNCRHGRRGYENGGE